MWVQLNTFVGGQGVDSSEGTQALPVGKIIEAKVFRKDNSEIPQNCMWCEYKKNIEFKERNNQIGFFSFKILMLSKSQCKHY